MIIPNYSIVHESDPIAMVKVRMRIHICFIAMSCPSCVPDSYLVVVKWCTFHTDTFDAVTAKAVGRGKLC